MKILTVIGNRPQFIKAAAVSPRLRERHQELLIHTGQHFDDELSAVFFAELGLPPPDRELGIALGSNTSQTARMLSALEPVVVEEAPDAVLVYGDTNSTLAGALAGAQADVPVAHVEAGMRSFDRSMPEELNRVLTDHAAFAAAVLLRGRGREPAPRGRERSGRARRRRDGRRRAGDAAARTRADRSRGGAGAGFRRVRARDRAPGRERRRSGAAGDARGPAAAGAADGRVRAPPPHSEPSGCGGAARRARAVRTCRADSAARLRRADRAAVPRARAC